MGTSSILIDTSILIEHFRKKNKLKSILYQLPSRYEIYCSVVTHFEMYVGAMDEQSSQYLEQLFDSIILIELNLDISYIASTIYKNLKKGNKLISINDIFIAATAIQYDFPLLTLNSKHFSRVNDLQILEK